MNADFMLNNNIDTRENMIPNSGLFEDSNCAREMDLRTIHFSDGVIFINGAITHDTAVRFASAMLALSREKKYVRIYINSNGGQINPGLMMYDIMQNFKGEMDVFCIGTAASMAALLLASGQKGRRFILPHSQVMIHEPLIMQNFGGSVGAIEKTAEDMIKVRDMTNGLIAKHTDHTLEQINEVTKEDFVMNAKEAVSFGICDEIRNFFE